MISELGTEIGNRPFGMALIAFWERALHVYTILKITKTQTVQSKYAPLHNQSSVRQVGGSN